MDFHIFTKMHKFKIKFWLGYKHNCWLTEPEGLFFHFVIKSNVEMTHFSFYSFLVNLLRTFFYWKKFVNYISGQNLWQDSLELRTLVFNDASHTSSNLGRNLAGKFKNKMAQNVQKEYYLVVNEICLCRFYQNPFCCIVQINEICNHLLWLVRPRQLWDRRKNGCFTQVKIWNSSRNMSQILLKFCIQLGIWTKIPEFEDERSETSEAVFMGWESSETCKIHLF